ncbi:SGNH/GDSL hydrolase family protein [Virgibacillus soli]|uniref:SGNH/GDSL hydrolase family protein n=1 Tax=Paracerasibacillus soli TaxID=480284 RepID=UPI0035EB8081
MKRKSIIIISIIVLLSAIGIGVYYQLSKPSSEEKLTHFKEKVKNPEEESAKDTKEENKPDTKEQSESVTKGFLTNAVEKAVTFFSDQKVNIVAIGDSLTEGVGDETNNEGYVGILDETINAEYDLAHLDNFGKRGNRTDQLLNRLDTPDIQSAISKAQIILITIGANDIMKVLRENITNITYEPFAKEKEAYENRLKQIFEKMRADNPRAKIYLIGFYNPFEGYFKDIKELTLIADEWNKTSKAITGQYEDIYFIPTADIFHHKTDQLLSDDHFHPNYDGYKLMSERVLEYITR